MAASSQCSRTSITFHPIDGYTSEWFILSKHSSVLFSEELPIKASHKYSTITLHWCPLYCSCSTVVHSCVCVCQVVSSYGVCNVFINLIALLVPPSLPSPYLSPSPPSLPSLLQQHLQVNVGETHLGLHRGQRFINAQEKDIILDSRGSMY